MPNLTLPQTCQSLAELGKILLDDFPFAPESEAPNPALLAEEPVAADLEVGELRERVERREEEDLLRGIARSEVKIAHLVAHGGVALVNLHDRSVYGKDRAVRCDIGRQG
jgi:hypothetical protein